MCINIIFVGLISQYVNNASKELYVCYKCSCKCKLTIVVLISISPKLRIHEHSKTFYFTIALQYNINFISQCLYDTNCLI